MVKLLILFNEAGKPYLADGNTTLAIAYAACSTKPFIHSINDDDGWILIAGTRKEIESVKDFEEALESLF